MPSFLSVSEEQHISTIRAAAPQYMTGFADLTHRGHILLALMKEQGMIEYGATSAAAIYQIRVYEPEVRVSNDTTRKVFTNHNAYEQCQVGVRWYEATDILTEIQWKMNQGRTQLIPLYDNKMKDLGSTMVKRLNEWIYRDGNLPAFQDGFQGFESALGDNGSTVAGDRVALPSDSYAGHNTNLAYFGGQWSNDFVAGDRWNAGLTNDWPHGSGWSNYDAFSPLLLNWSSNRWAAGSGLWADNCEEVLREGSAIMRARNGYMNVNELPLLYLMPSHMYSGAENYYSQRFRIVQPYRSGDLGFPGQNTIYLDGVVLKADYACPVNTFYGLCPQHIEMFFMICRNPSGEEPMIDVDGPVWDTSSAAYLMRIQVGGNLRLQPKFMIKGKDYAR